MKNIVVIAILFLLYSCKKEEPKKENLYPEAAQTPEQLGKEIYEGKGNCIGCHQPEEKVIGPSIQEIATLYKAKNANMIAFLKGKAEPIVDPSQYEVMKTNFAITKTMSDQELKALEAYFYSFAK
jgi:cytochrome c